MPTPLQPELLGERRRHAGRRLVVLDDDPTGSQTVHDVDLVFEPDPDELGEALREPGSTCFVLTNSRSLSEADAVSATGLAARHAFALEADLGVPVDVLSRGDSTLRGHVIAEVEAIKRARREVLGSGYDGVLFCPAYPEAGRVTVDDVHLAWDDGEWVPVGETDYARDATFGYSASNLAAFLAERSGGAIDAAGVGSIGLEDIRDGGAPRVAEIVGALDGGWAVVNAERPADLDVVALAMLEVEATGRRLLARGGPSLARALAGMAPWGRVPPERLGLGARAGAHGLVVVGSHVGLSGRQLERLEARTGLAQVELDVAAVADPDRAGPHVAAVARALAAAMREDDAVLTTTRELLRGRDGEDSLRIARAVSAAIVEVVAAVRAVRPAWVVAKGGITSHDVARHGLGIRRATVLGQMGDGIVSVVRPVSAPAEVRDAPYVIFAGNVGDENTLADVVDTLRRAA